MSDALPVDDRDRLDNLDYGFVTIPQEIKDAWQNLHASADTLGRLNRYTHKNRAMVRDAQRARVAHADSRQILQRFFITAKTDSRSGIK